MSDTTAQHLQSQGADAWASDLASQDPPATEAIWPGSRT